MAKMIPWKDWLDLFLLRKRAQGLADRTLADHTYHITKFFQFANVTKESLETDILHYFQESGLAPSTVNTRRKCLKCFFSFCVKKGYLKSSPMDEIAKRKEDEKPRALPEEIAIGLLRQPDTKTFVGLRDYAVFILTLDCGIRPSEAFKLNISDLDFKTLTVTVRAEIAKTRVSRDLPICALTAEAIREFMNERPTEWRETIPLFPTERGGQVGTRAWARRLEHYSITMGSKVTAYQLRHTFATCFLTNGGHAFALQRMLGHTTLTMTRRYVSLTDTDMKAQHDLASPINRLVPTRTRAPRRIAR